MRARKLLHQRQATRPRVVPADVAALIELLGADVDRTTLDRAIADFKIGRITLAALIAAIPVPGGAGRETRP